MPVERERARDPRWDPSRLAVVRGAAVEDDHAAAGAREEMGGDQRIDARAQDEDGTFLFRHGPIGRRSRRRPPGFYWPGRNYPTPKGVSLRAGAAPGPHAVQPLQGVAP